MKITILLVLLTLGVIAQPNKPVYEFFDGTVVAFANVNKDFTTTKKDTAVGQVRQITLATDHTLFQISWQMNESTDTLFHMEYYVEKIYPSVTYNETTKKGNNRYINYLAFDKEYYPMLLMVAEDNSHGYLYYYWDSASKQFKKSEKIVFAPIKTNEEGS